MHLSLLKNAANRLSIVMVHPSIILHKVSLHKIYLDLLKISRPTGEGGIYNNRFFVIFIAFLEGVFLLLNKF